MIQLTPNVRRYLYGLSEDEDEQPSGPRSYAPTFQDEYQPAVPVQPVQTAAPVSGGYGDVGDDPGQPPISPNGGASPPSRPAAAPGPSTPSSAPGGSSSVGRALALLGEPESDTSRSPGYNDPTDGETITRPLPPSRRDEEITGVIKAPPRDDESTGMPRGFDEPTQDEIDRASVAGLRPGQSLTDRPRTHVYPAEMVRERQERDAAADEERRLAAWNRYYAEGGEVPYGDTLGRSDPRRRMPSANPPGGTRGQERRQRYEADLAALVESARAEMVGAAPTEAAEIVARYRRMIRDREQEYATEQAEAERAQAVRREEMATGASVGRVPGRLENAYDAISRLTEYADTLGGNVERATDHIPGLQGQRRLSGGLLQTSANVRDWLIGWGRDATGYEQIGKEGYNADMAFITRIQERYGYDPAQWPPELQEAGQAAFRRMNLRAKEDPQSAAERNPDTETLRTGADLVIAALTLPLGGPAAEIGAVRAATGAGRASRAALSAAGAAIDPAGAAINAGLEGAGAAIRGAGVASRAAGRRIVEAADQRLERRAAEIAARRRAPLEDIMDDLSRTAGEESRIPADIPDSPSVRPEMLDGAERQILRSEAEAAVEYLSSRLTDLDTEDLQQIVRAIDGKSPEEARSTLRSMWIGSGFKGSVDEFRQMVDDALTYGEREARGRFVDRPMEQAGYGRRMAPEEAGTELSVDPMRSERRSGNDIPPNRYDPTAEPPEPIPSTRDTLPRDTSDLRNAMGQRATPSGSDVPSPEQRYNVYDRRGNPLARDVSQAEANDLIAQHRGATTEVARPMGEAESAAYETWTPIAPFAQGSGAISGAIGGALIGDENDSWTDRLQRAAVAAGLGAGGARLLMREGMPAAGRLIDSLISRGILSADTLLTHPDALTRVKALMYLAAEGKANDEIVRLPAGVIGFVKMERADATKPGMDEAIGLLSRPMTAGQIRAAAERPGAIAEIARATKEMVVDAITGLDLRGSKADERAADMAIVRGTTARQRVAARKLADEAEAAGVRAPLERMLPGMGRGERLHANHPVVTLAERVADEMGLPRPTVYVVPEEDFPNAAAQIRAHGDPHLVVTRPLLEGMLTQDELADVFRHELGHIGQQAERRLSPSLLDRAEGALTDIANRLSEKIAGFESVFGRVDDTLPQKAVSGPGDQIPRRRRLRRSPPTTEGEPTGPSAEDILGRSQRAVGVPEPSDKLDGISWLERARRSVVREMTDRQVDINELQDLARKELGRELTGDEMVAVLQRVNPTGAAKQEIDRSIGPALRTLDNEKTVLTATLADGTTETFTERQLLSRFMELVNNRDVAQILGNPDRIFPGGITGEESGRAAREIFNRLDPDLQQRLGAAANVMFDVVERYRDKLEKAGVFSAEMADDLRTKYKHWTPTRILDYLRDRDAPGAATQRTISLNDRHVREYTFAGTQKSREDSVASLIRYVQQAEEDIAKNNTFNAFYNLRERVPGWQEMIREVTPSRATEKGYEAVRGFVNGERRAFWVPAPLAAAIRMEQPGRLPLGLAKLTTIFRELITRTPVFIAGQVPLDAMSYFIREMSREGGDLRAAPRVIAALGAGYAEAFKGITESRFYGDTGRFLEAGGGMAGFYDKNARAASQTLKDLDTQNVFVVKNGSDLKRLVKWLGSPEGLKWTFSGESVQAFGQRVELAPRTASYRLGLERAERSDALVSRRTSSRPSSVRGLPSGEDAPLSGASRTGSPAPSSLDEVLNPQSAQPSPGEMAIPEQRGLAADVPGAPRSGPSGPVIDEDGVDTKRGELLAMAGARDVTLDFQRGGRLALVLNQAIPFFNVGIQSSVTPWRAFRENPKGFMVTTIGLLGGVTAAAEAWNRHDRQMSRDYDDIPQYIKDRGLIFMTGQSRINPKTGEREPSYVIIPLRELAPFVIGAREVSGRVMPALGLQGPEEQRAWGSVLTAMLGAASPIQASRPSDLFNTFNPPGISTGLQIAADKDFFRGRQIDTERSNEEAGIVARELSKRFGGSAGQWEFGLRDITGGVGAALLTGADLGANAAGLFAPNKPLPRSLEVTPGVGGVVGRWVGNQTGGRLDREREPEKRISPSVDRLLQQAQVDPKTITPVGREYRNAPLTKAEQARWQRAANQLIRSELPSVRDEDDWDDPEKRANLISRKVQQLKQQAFADSVGWDDAEIQNRIEVSKRRRLAR